VKQVKILFLFTAVVLFGLVLASCAPGGTQPTQGWSGAAYQDGILYVGSMDGKIVAVNTSAQSEEWSYAITMLSGGFSCGSSSQGVVLYGTPVVAKNLVYIGAYNGEVLAMNSSARSQNLPFPCRGEGEWDYNVAGAIVGSPVVVGDTTYVGSSDGRVYALTTSGDLKWRSKPLSDRLWTSPSATVEGDTVYVSTFDGYIYALPTKGASLAKDVEPSRIFKADAGFASSPVVYENSIFVGSFDYNLYAVKIGYDEPMWKFHGGKWFWATPLVRDGVVYAGCLDGKIYAIDAISGEELWEFNTGSSIVASPIFVDDLLVVASENSEDGKGGKIYAFDVNATPEDRVLIPLKTIPLDAQIWAPLCAHDGIVYVRAQDNCLYTVDIDQGRVARVFL
jgi:outer membrane protein assembly factor BamB